MNELHPIAPYNLLYPIVVSGLPTGYLLLVARWGLQISHVWRITRNVCENSSFEKIRTIPINLIQLHYFDDVINEFNLIDLEIRWMNCDFNDLKKETINYKGLPGYLLYPIVLSGLPTGYLLLVAHWRLQISHIWRITRNMCGNSSFEKIRTIPINLIQLHYFDDVINEFNLIDLEIRWMNCDFSDLKNETINYKGLNNWQYLWPLTGYLLYPIVVNGLPTSYLLLVARWRLQITHVWRITRNVCENSSFEKIRTIPINLIQLHYFDDVINEFNLIDLEIRWMNCDFSDLKKKTINYKGVNLENLCCIWWATGLPGYLLFPIVSSGLAVGYPL